MKRVYCLYRVSTLGQVEKDDIPMQHQACREFANLQGWEIIQEFTEKGISGFKVSSDDREAMQQLKKDAILKKFDILLVFMFDRLGRRDDETPFVVEWFVKNGIAVWSTQEGEQRFENHVDKLLNYIRYWQASGESIKTSIRTKTRLEQLVKEGRYTGGGVPYGYKLIKAGRFNKRNHEVFELEIDESKSEIVKEIFYKYVFDKMGPHQIATYLTQKGIGSNNEAHWHSCSISNILKNRTYIGILKSGSAYSDPIHRLRIVDDDIFQMAQKVRANKICVHQRKSSTRAKAQGKCTGVLYCGHCGSRMTLSTNMKKDTRKDGSIREYRRIRYICYNKRRHLGACNGQTGYSSEKIDKIVVSNILNTFHSVQTMAGQTEIKKQLMSQIDTAQTNLSTANYELECQYRKLGDLKDEVIRVIRGTSGFGSILLSELIDKTEAAIKDLQFEVKQLEFELKQQILCLQTFEEKYLNLTELAESFSMKSGVEQRQIISQFVRKIHIRQGYELTIEYKFNEL